MDLRQKNLLLFGIAIVLVIGAWLLFWPPQSRITMGLDVKGGLSVILHAQPDEGQVVTADMMDRAEAVIRNRVDGLGVKEASVQRQGTNQLVIQVPGIDDPQAALNILGETGRLEFVDVASITDTATVAALQAGEKGVKLIPGTYTVIEENGTKMTGEIITDANVAQDGTGKIVVDVAMNAAGARVWGSYTSSHIGNQVAIVLDGMVKSAPVVNSAITAGKTQISGSFTVDEAKALRTVLISGSLPVTLIKDEALIVGPTLGQDSLQKGVLAGIIGLALVALYIICFYRGLGLIAASALGVFASMFLGVLGLMSLAGVFSLTLPGIAGIVLTIGMAADSSVLIMERIKEEAHNGKSIVAAVDSGSRHGIMTSLDADVVSLVSALVLYLVAVGSVKGFALTLMIGICCDATMMLLYKRPLLILLAKTFVKAPKFWGIKTAADKKVVKATKGGEAHA